MTLSDRETDLRKWNAEQKALWQMLCNAGWTGRNNCEVFLCFAHYFRNYVYREHRFPSYEDTVVSLFYRE